MIIDRMTEALTAEQSVEYERARYANTTMPVAISLNLVGGCTTTALFWGAAPPLYLAIFTGIFAVIAAYWVFYLSARFRRTAFTPKRVRRLYQLLSMSGLVTSLTWGIGMYYIFPYGQLAVQFSFMCALVLLGVTVAICFAAYYPAALWTFLPFAGIAVFVLAIQPKIFYAELFSVLMFVPAQVFMSLLYSRIHVNSLRLRFENIDLVGQLTVQRDLAEAALSAKSTFLAAASHDLRQPLHALGLFLYSLQRTDLNTKQRELAANIESSTNAAREMLDTLLDFSKLEAGAVVAKPVSFPLQPMLHKLENEFAPLADAKNLVYRMRDTTTFAHADPALVELILRNFISNAIRYTEHGGLLIACRSRGEEIALEVWDTGIGIPASQHRDIFREFYQLANPERNRNKGLGLGLAIVEGLARTMELQVGLASNPGRGSVFRLVLPAGAEQHEAKLPAPIAHAGLLGGCKVLLVEDDQAARTAMAALLREWGCHCEAFELIEEAFDALSGFAPDLVITDFRLREKRTGQEVFDGVTARLGRRVPAIIVTGDTAPERLREALASGATLLHKPVAPPALHAAMESLLERTSHE